ncbi:MAG: DUF2251 domain-containing protein [Alphaproteobacteria bacterium]|nr:DUF2251 domain-containing protein [Alphaproteobacteria bacterium]
MAIVVTATEMIRVGEAGHVEAEAPDGTYAAVFEDDGDTGYFYALDFARGGQPIENALHIYNVADIADRHIPSEVKIGWSVDSTKAILLINETPHAVFDFAARRGYCRSGFPPPAEDSGWSGHAWSDGALELFSKKALNS